MRRGTIHQATDRRILRKQRSLKLPRHHLALLLLDPLLRLTKSGTLRLVLQHTRPAARRKFARRGEWNYRPRGC
jgi:hypothetical protein